MGAVRKGIISQQYILVSYINLFIYCEAISTWLPNYSPSFWYRLPSYWLNQQLTLPTPMESHIMEYPTTQYPTIPHMTPTLQTHTLQPPTTPPPLITITVTPRPPLHALFTQMYPSVLKTPNTPLMKSLTKSAKIPSF